MAVISVAVGAFAGLAQNDLKRLWAYSSIASIGYALVGLAAGGVVGIQSMLMFMVLYVIDVTGFFACLAALTRGGKPMQTLDDFAGLARERPALAIAMSFFALSGLGMPPFSGLWAKYYVFKAALGVGPRADRRHRPDRQRRRRLLLFKTHPADVVRHRDHADRHAHPRPPASSPTPAPSSPSQVCSSP